MNSTYPIPTWTIESRAGVVFGDYPGATPKDALMAMFAEAYGDYGSPSAGAEDDWLVYPQR